ncbi:MAG: hypothetical protein IPL84_01395 [Chitinophagaceae bacterium]|nr:hypothetical protein [Chitinophagaceae bacterium]
MKTLIIVLALFACGSQIKEESGMPTERPKDFTLRYHLDGGMRYYSENININADSCVYNINDGGKITHRVFTLSPKEMDDLYDMLRKNKFDNIEFTTGSQVYDRGGVSMQVGWNKDQQRIQVDNSQMSFVKKNWLNEWGTICAYLEQLVKGR